MKKIFILLVFAMLPFQTAIVGNYEQNPDQLVGEAPFANRIDLAQQKSDFNIMDHNYVQSQLAYSEMNEFQLDLKRSDKRIMVGKPVPDFEVTLLDGKEKVSNKSLLGKFYLIDFWATWCNPCVAEMKNLQKAYEKYKDKNFVILSLSLDRKIEDIKKFRGGKWKMPWLHAFMYDEANKNVIKTFDVKSIPKPILVGFDGRIVATEISLRGENLQKTLADFIK
jgi:thiol-disulfide isomerase/thioredoxin